MYQWLPDRLSATSLPEYKSLPDWRSAFGNILQCETKNEYLSLKSVKRTKKLTELIHELINRQLL
jgi:hypothetical protein